VTRSWYKKVFFFDESRFGTHSKLGYGWFPTGERTQVAVKLGFKNFYLYSAVETKTGENFTLEIPYINTNCMNVFLEEFAKQYAGDEIILVMDGAGWHKSKDLQVPDNIEIILLPPYSPELNPVERFWQYIKRYVIKNKIYKNLKELKNAVAKFLNSIDAETIKSICTTDYIC
jgi:transposase